MFTKIQSILDSDGNSSDCRIVLDQNLYPTFKFGDFVELSDKSRWVIEEVDKNYFFHGGRVVCLWLARVVFPSARVSISRTDDKTVLGVHYADKPVKGMNWLYYAFGTLWKIKNVDQASPLHVELTVEEWD